MRNSVRKFSAFSYAWLMVLGSLLLVGSGRADDYSFANSMQAADVLEKRGDLPAALKIYEGARTAEAGNDASLCILARRYCDLMSLTNSSAMKKSLADRALECSLRAGQVNSNNATAHACAAVCYAKECAFADIKGELNFSRLFKLEAEKTIALDPKQDVAYYLLGRWNYGIANVGFLSRAFVKVIYGGLPQASNAAAIANFKQAIVLAPDRIINHAGLAMVYAATGERPLELAELKACRDLKPSGVEDQEAQRDALKRLAELGQ